MISHHDAQRLAATGIDFPMSIWDDEALRAHLDACDVCRRDAAALRATARDLASIAMRPAPVRVRMAVTAAAAEPQSGRLPTFTFGLPAGFQVGLAALLLLALLAAMLLAALIVGAPRSLLRADVPEGSAIPAPATGPEAIALRRVGPSVTTCAGPRSLRVAGGAMWFTCPDGSLWQGTTSGGAAVHVAENVTGVASGTHRVWALSADHVDELDTVTTGPIGRLNGIGGSAGAADGTTLAVLDPAAGVVRWLDTRGATPSVVATTPVGPHPVGITIAFSSAWVTKPDDGKVVRIDVATHTVTAEIAVSRQPWSIVAAADRIWVADDADGTVASIDPATNDAALVDVDRTGDNSYWPGIAVAPDGSIWVTDSHRGKVIRIDPRVGTSAASSIASTGPLSELAIIDGSLWVVDSGGSPQVAQIPNHGALIEFAVETGH